VQECILKKLQSAAIRAPLPGLVVHPTGLQLVDKHFTCCAGKGVVHDVKADETAFCSLNKRMALVAALSRQAYARSNTESELLAQAAATPITKEITQTLDAIANAQGKHGLVISAGEPGMNLRVAYAVALAAVWRFDIRAVVVELGQQASLENFVLSLNPNNQRQPEVVVVAGIGRLWETQRLEQLDIVIGAAHRGRMPLFACLEPFEVAADIEINAGFKRSVVKNRIKQLKNKHPFSFLSPGVKNQLAAVCDGSKDSGAPKKMPTKENRPLSPEA
jgi:hypothetical protein